MRFMEIFVGVHYFHHSLIWFSRCNWIASHPDRGDDTHTGCETTLGRIRVWVFPKLLRLSCSHRAAGSDRRMRRSSLVMWICVIYLAGVAVFLTIAERAPIDPGHRFSDDD